MLNERVPRLLTVLAVSAAFNAALTLQNAWPSLWVTFGAGVSVELLVLLVFLAFYLERRAELGRPLAWCLAISLFLLIAGRYAAVTAHSLFGRPINLYFDLPHLPEVAAMTVGARSAPEILGIAAVALAIPVMLLLSIHWGVGAIARCLSDKPLRRATGGIAAAGIVVFFAASLPAFQWAGRGFAFPVSTVYAEQAKFLAEALTGPRDPKFVSPPGPPADPAALNGADVFVIFLESYGEVAYRLPDISGEIRARAAEAGRHLSAKGWHVVSGLFESPTFGGASWLAHSSFLTGTTVSENRDYELLLSSDRTSFVRDFAKAGYRTVALMPGLKLAWPEGKFYSFDKIYDAAGLDYAGPPFGWWEIPDQFTLGRLDERELRATDRKPLFVVYPTIMSHMPFAPVPPYLADWARAIEPEAYARAPDNSREALGDWNAARAAYREAMLYNLATIEGFLAERAPENALVVVLGDHQPPGLVSGAGASRLVPVHVFSRDAARIAGFREAGLKDGFVPSGNALGDFAALHRRFADALK